MHRRDEPTTADARHYNCFDSDQRIAAAGGASSASATNGTLSMATDGGHIPNWQQIWRQGACEAKLLDELVRANVSFSRELFESKMLSKYETGECTINI